MELDAFLTYLGESAATEALATEMSDVSALRGLLAVVPMPVTRARSAARQPVLTGTAA